MATLLYSYKDKSGATKYVGADSKAAAQKLAGGASVSQVSGFSSDKGDASKSIGNTTPQKMSLKDLSIGLAKGEKITQEDIDKPKTSLKDLSIGLAQGEKITQEQVDKGFKPQTAVPAQQPSVLPPITSSENPLNFNPNQSAERISNFNSALNVAIDQARQQRQDSTLDFLGGVIPSGAAPATSFASVLGAFNSDSAPLEASLISSASGFARDQEDRRYDIFQTEQQRQIDEENAAKDVKNNIRDLALTVAQSGGDQSVVDSILTFTESGDVEGAIRAAAASLNAKAKDGVDVRQVGSNLVEVTTGADGEATTKVLYTAPPRETTSSGGGGGTSGGSGGGTASYTKTQMNKLAAKFGTNWQNTTTKEEQLSHLFGSGQPSQDDLSFPLPEGVQGPVVELTNVDFYTAKPSLIDSEMSRLLGPASPVIKKALTAELQKDFMNDWVYMQEAQGRPIDPIKYFTEVWGPAAGVKLPTEKEEKEKDSGKRNPLGT